MTNLPFHVDLSGKTAVVTGGGGILCSGMARALASCGAKVAVLGRTKAKTDVVADEINKAGLRALSVQADVLDADSMREARQIIEDELGICDILINGAGGNDPRATTSKEFFETGDLEFINFGSNTLGSNHPGSKERIKTFFDLDPEHLQSVFNLNFIGTLIPVQVFALSMANRSGATIINISSMNAFSPLTKVPAYSAAKAAVSNFTQWLAVHFAKVGIRVNAIAPGFFLSEQNRSLLLKADGSLSERAEKIIGMTPMERFGEVDELTGTLLWLVHEPSSSFVNGIVVPVDGGFSAYSGV